jgi:flagellin
MGLRINNNIAAFNAYRNLNITSDEMASSLEKLSSGFRINRAADDAAGLSISENLRSQVSGFKVATRNAQDAVSLVQTAEGALNETEALLHRMRDLAVQSANGTNDTAAVNAAQAEVNQSLAEIDRIGNATVYGNLNLLSANATFTFQVGASGAGANQIAVAVSAALSTSLGVNGVTVGAGFTSSISTIDAAISYVSSLRSNLGAYQNRFQHTIANLGVSVENLSAAESRIRDTDMASEMVNFTRTQILSQAGTAMLAQANSSSSSVLKLLQ